MMRICVLAGLVAGISAAGHQAKVDQNTYQIDATGYQVNGEFVTLDTNVDDSANTQSVTVGESVGSRLATAEKYYKIDLVKKKTVTTLAATKGLEAEIADIAQWTKDGPDAIKALEKQIANAALKSAAILKVLPCAGGCDTIGESEVVLLLEGEIYANVGGLLTCTWKLPNGKVVHSAGIGKQTGVSGKASAAVCTTPVLGPAHVTSKSFKVEVGLKIGTLAALKMVTGNAQQVTFVATPPKVTVDTSTRFEIHTSKVDRNGEVQMDFMVTDLDSAFKDISGTITGGSSKSFDKGTVRAVKDLGDGKFHMQIGFKPKARPSVPRDEFSVKLTVKDNYNSAAAIEIPVRVVHLRSKCWNSFIYDFTQSCNTPKPDVLRKRTASKTWISQRIQWNDGTFSRQCSGCRDHFAMLNEAYLTPPRDGTYTFETASDDGSHVFIDGKEVVNNDGCHGRSHRTGNIALKGGQMYKIVSTFFENGGGANYDVWWRGPGMGRTHVGPNYLQCD